MWCGSGLTRLGGEEFSTRADVSGSSRCDSPGQILTLNVLVAVSGNRHLQFALCACTRVGGPQFPSRISCMLNMAKDCQGFFSTTKQVNLMGSLNQDLNASDNLPLSKCSMLCSPGSWQQLNPGVPFSPQQPLLIKAACQINPLWPWGEGGDGFSKLWTPLAEGGFPTPFVLVQHLKKVFQAGIWPWEEESS